MRRHEGRIRTCLVRWVSRRTMERIVDPVMADTRFEVHHLLLIAVAVHRAATRAKGERSA